MMPGSPSDDIKMGFIKELRGYIPALRDKAHNLGAHEPDASQKELMEFYRLVHTIRGASSLVKLEDLSQVASEFEGVLEQIIGKQLSLHAQVLEAIVGAVDYFDVYCAAPSGKEPSIQNRRSAVLASFLKVRKFATTAGGQDFLSTLINEASRERENHYLYEDERKDLEGLESEYGVPPSDIADADREIENTNRVSLQQELLEDFFSEAEDHFQDLGEALGKLEDRIDIPTELGPSDKELLRLIRRSVHTIKGAAAVIKLQTVAGWGHEVEDVLDWLYEDARVITPAQIKVIADAADMLERFITAPQDVPTPQVERLRVRFKQIIGSDIILDPGSESGPVNAQDGRTGGTPQGEACHQKDVGADHAGSERPEKEMSLDVDPAKSLRVDLARVESVVNLASESSIALSSFDQDMEGLDCMIAEIERTRLQLNRTARDLELGFEGNAIRHLGSSGPVEDFPNAGAGSEAGMLADFDVLELDRYSELNLIIRSLNETAVDVSTISRQLSDIHSGFESYLNRLRLILSELNQKTMRLRMAPMSTIVNRMRRTVRETADQLGKPVRLTIKGDHIELDKVVWEKLADPLMHLLRNAIDHGIESPDLRNRANKPQTGTIDLSAAYIGNQVVLRVRDDGTGFDFDGIRKAFAMSHPGLDVDGMGEKDLTDLTFQSGFSTRETISAVSGRGVGLDVVRENIRKLKGSVGVENTTKGAGTTFCIHLPITMAAMQALFFDVDGRRYATALHDIKEVFRIDPKSIEGQDEAVIVIEGHRTPFFRVSDIMGPGVGRAKPAEPEKWPLVLIVGDAAWQGAVAIDRMCGQREIVIKNLGSHLGTVKGIAGATTMGDGKVVPILNFKELLRGKSGGHRQSEPKPYEEIEKSIEILVVDDSVTIRNVVSHLMEAQGWMVVTAKDGVEAIECLYNRRPDLIVLDIEMPRMNGFEFLSAIRGQDKYKALPVVMHTSRASKKHREKAAALGVDDFVTKPYDEKEFVALVKRLSCQN